MTLTYIQPMGCSCTLSDNVKTTLVFSSIHSTIFMGFSKFNEAQGALTLPISAEIAQRTQQSLLQNLTDFDN